MESGESTRRFLLKTKSKLHRKLPETIFMSTDVFPELKLFVGGRMRTVKNWCCN